MACLPCANQRSQRRSITPNQTMPLRFASSGPLTVARKSQRCRCQNSCHHFFKRSQQHFAGIFASEPIRLSEIDHLSFLTTHAFYIFPPVNGAPLARASRERGAPLSHFYNKFCEIFTLVSSSFHFLLYM